MKKQILMIIVTICIFSVTPIKLFSADTKSSDGGTGDSKQSSSGQKKGGGQDGSSDSSGSIKAGDKTGTIESYVLATGVAHRAAKKIANSISPKLANIKQVIILDDTMRAEFNALVAFRAKISGLTFGYQEVSKKVPISPELQKCIEEGREKEKKQEAMAPISLSDISSILQSFAQLGSLLKTDVAVNGVDVTLTDEIIIDEVTSELLSLKKVDFQVLRPTLYFAALMQNGSEVSAAIKKVFFFYQLRNDAEILINTQLKDAAIAKKNCSNLLEEIQRLEGELSAKKEMLKKLNEEVDKFISSWISDSHSGDDGKDGKTDGQKQPSPVVNNIYLGSSTDGNTSGKKLSDKKSQAAPQQKPSLADLIMAQLLLDKYNDNKTALLTLQIQQGGGGYLVKNNLWIFFGAWPLQHSGGIVVTFSLISPVQGDILAAGAVPYYRGFLKSGKVECEVDKLMEYK